jgi:hypothetical protein
MIKKILIIVIVLSGLLYLGYCITKETKHRNTIAKETNKMSDIIMDYGDYEVMMPPEMYFPGDLCRYIFAVPEHNMVGTNELDNAVKLLEFKKDEQLKMHTVKKDFMEMVTGPFEFRFLPVWSDKEIAYTQSKALLIINIPEKKVEIHTISPGLYTGHIENLAVLNIEKRIFVFEIDNPDAEVQGFEKILKVIQFTNETFSVLAEHPAGKKTMTYTEPWFVYDKNIFLYNDRTTKIEAYDETFKTIKHPLADEFNNNQVEFRCIREIVIHPTLPFALIVEQGKWPTKEQLVKFDSLPEDAQDSAREALYKEGRRTSLYLFRWKEHDVKNQFIPLLSIAGSIWNSYNPVNSYCNFTFSPDGKWVVFRDETESTDKPNFVAVPVSTDNPLYLGKPLKLGKVLRTDAYETRSSAWATKPLAFIVSDGKVLYRWELENVKNKPRVNAQRQ